MHIALIRGSVGRNYELPNFEFGDGNTVDVFIARGLQLGVHSPYFHIHRLLALSDLTARMGPRAQGLLDLTVGSREHLFGLEKALNGYDIAHGGEITWPVTWQAVRARGAGRVSRVVSTVFENIPFKANPNRWVSLREAQLVTGIDHFQAVTERARLHLLTAGVPNDRITVIPFGVDVERFSPRADRRPGPMRIMTSARLERAKGVEDLVIAVGLLASRGIDAELVFVGSGPMKRRLVEIAGRVGIAERVSFRSSAWIDMPSVYRDADIFVLASAPTQNWREQFGYALIEALATGLPCLVGASGSLPEVAGRTDVLVYPHDPLNLADELGRLIGDPTRRQELGEWNRRRALDLYDQRRTAAQILDMYEKAMLRPPRDATQRKRRPSGMSSEAA